VWARLARAKGQESWASLARRAGLADTSNLHVGKRGLSRDRLERLARAVEDPALVALARGDVYFDEVVSIVPLGDKQVYDLTIPETHNFLANDVCVHNTSFVLNLAVNVASPRAINVPGPGERGSEKREPGFGVAVFSLEMPREQLATRMVCSEGRVDVGKLRGGHLTPEDWRRLTEGASYLSMLPIWLDDTPAIGLLELRAKCRRIQAEYNRPAKDGESERRVGLVVIDYLQLMSGRPGVSSREQEISEISRGLKQLAKELRVPVIALSQLNRAVETRATKEKRPQLSDLRESGAIEQDADTIIFIYRDEYYNPENTEARGIAELIIAKQRNGPTGKVMTRFTSSCTRFDNLQPGDYPEYMDDE
jgi:replicative DNA helicase